MKDSNTRTALLLTLVAAAVGAVMPLLPAAARVAAGSILIVVAGAAVTLIPSGRTRTTVVVLVGAIAAAQVVLAAVDQPAEDSGIGVVVALAIELLVLAAAMIGALVARAGLVRRDQFVQDKDRLLASISHQLRTPLTAVAGFAEVLRTGAEHSTPDERRSMLTDLAVQAFELSALIDNLLVASRAELDQLEVVSVPVALRSQLAQGLEVWTPDALVGHRVLVEGGSPVVAGDPGRIRQILHNLVTNAVRHGGQHIRIRLEESDGLGSVIVTDDGAGIPPEVTNRLFDTYRAPVPSIGALGLGLGVSRHLAQLMRGELTYHREDGWTCFRLVLPLAPRRELYPSR